LLSAKVWSSASRNGKNIAASVLCSRTIPAALDDLQQQGQYYHDGSVAQGSGRTNSRRRDGNNTSNDLNKFSLVIVPQAGFNCILIAQRLNRVISRLLPEYQQTIEHAATI
jgi:hypothetical protein